MIQAHLVRAKSTPCQWCGYTFEIAQAPFDAAKFREWNEMVRQHKKDCKEAFLMSPAAAAGLTEAGIYFLGLA